MGTRIRKHPEHIFELVCEVGIPSDGNKSPWISWKFPYNYKQQDTLKSVPEFAYPVEFHDNVVHHFSFVLTNCDSKWTFGFCRHVPNSMSCYVILSSLPWHEMFYRILNHIAELTNKQKPSNCASLQCFLESLFHSPVPDPGMDLCIYYSITEKFVVPCPDHNKLPSIPENRNITEYFNAVDAHNMMTIYASMLHERRILMVSKKLSRLSACVQAANSLIFPMHWQHIFIPVLPKHLLDYLSAPMPFLIGVPASTFSRMKPSDIGDVVLLYADDNKIESPYADLDALPTEVLQNLRNDLKYPHDMLGDSVARAFLRASVRLIGGYWNALRLKPGEEISFSPELFIQTRSPPMQPFLEKMLQLQIFQQFIESRLKMLNSGQGVSDEFEFELTAHADKTSKRFQVQYKEWVNYMKKEGFAIFKHVKVKVRDTSKKAYKDIRSKIQDRQHHKIVHQKDSSSGIKNGKVASRTLDVNNQISQLCNSNNVMSASSFKTKEPENIVTLAVPEDDNISNSSCDKNRSRNESPLLTFDPIDTDLMKDMQNFIFQPLTSCTSDGLATKPEHLVTDCHGNATSYFESPSKQRSSISESPPPLLPRPPAKSPTRSSFQAFPVKISNPSKKPSEAPLILLDDFQSIETNNNIPITLEQNGNSCVSDQLTNPFGKCVLESKTIGSSHLKSTNPFHQSNSSLMFSGPHVRDLVNQWQSTNHVATATASKAIKDKSDIAFSVPYRSQPMLRTATTPYAYSPALSNNPFVTAETKNCLTSEHRNKVMDSSEVCPNSPWEDFQ